MPLERLRPPNYRVERRPDGLTPDTDVTLQGISTYLRETFLRHRTLEDLLQLREVDLLTHIRNGIILVERMEIGERASNGLLVDLRWNNEHKDSRSPFGAVLDAAMNNPRLPTHNRDHCQRVEDHAVIMAVNVMEVRRQQELQPWISSLMLFLRWHDVDQVLTEYRNETRVKSGMSELNTKLGHGLAGAVMLLAMHIRYAEEANIPVGDAWRICAGAAAMMLLHDNPEQFEKAVNARTPAWRWRKGRKQYMTGPELASAFRAGELDVFSLLPHQLIELLKFTKGLQKEFMQHSMYGLHPLFEKEYKQELEDLDNNMRPLIEEIVENPALYAGWRKGFTIAAEIGLRADQDDMIAPPYEAILRTFLTPISHNRTFFRPNIEDPLDQIMNGQGNVDPAVDSDVRRILWEFFHIDTLEGSSISNSKYIKRFNRDNAIMGILAFKKFGLQLLRGNLDFIDAIYEKRIDQVGNQAVNKARLSLWKKIALIQRFNWSHIQEGISRIEHEVKPVDSILAHRYSGKAHELLHEWQTIKDNLQHKVLTTEQDVPLERTIQEFEQLVDRATQLLCEIHHVAPKQLKRYKSRVERGKYPYLPYKTYDPLGGRPRTYMSPRKHVAE